MLTYLFGLKRKLSVIFGTVGKGKLAKRSPFGFLMGKVLLCPKGSPFKFFSTVPFFWEIFHSTKGFSLLVIKHEKALVFSRRFMK